jgi:hypothetical protein
MIEETDTPGVMKAMVAVAKRDLVLAWKRPGDVLNPLFFFAMVATLFPLAVGPSNEQLEFSGPGVLWTAALLAMLLSLNSLFVTDFEDGSLDQMLVSAVPLPALVLGKSIAHWLTSGLPLVLISPLVAITFRMPVSVTGNRWAASCDCIAQPANPAARNAGAYFWCPNRFSGGVRGHCCGWSLFSCGLCCVSCITCTICNSCRIAYQ